MGAQTDAASSRGRDARNIRGSSRSTLRSVPVTLTSPPPPARDLGPTTHSSPHPLGGGTPHPALSGVALLTPPSRGWHSSPHPLGGGTPHPALSGVARLTLPSLGWHSSARPLGGAPPHPTLSGCTPHPALSGVVLLTPPSRGWYSSPHPLGGDTPHPALSGVALLTPPSRGWHSSPRPQGQAAAPVRTNKTRCFLQLAWNKTRDAPSSASPGGQPRTRRLIRQEETTGRQQVMTLRRNACTDATAS